MSRITGIRERIMKWWQSYNLWVFVALIFMFIIVGWIAEHRSGAYRSLGIAATLLSIVLSIIVIVYAMAQNVKADIAQDRMERLVERVEDRIQVVGEDVSKKIDGVLLNPSMQVNAGDGQDKAKTGIEAKGKVNVADGSQTNAEGDSRYIGKGEVYLSFLSTSDIVRVFAYFLLRSHQLQRALSIDQFTLIFDPLLKMPTSEVGTYVLGILQGMICGLEGYLYITEQKNVYLKKLPENYEQQIKILVSRMKDRHRDIEVYFNEIDAIQ